MLLCLLLLCSIAVQMLISFIYPAILTHSIRLWAISMNLADDYAEAYMGCYSQIKQFPNNYHLPKEPVSYIESLKTFVNAASKDLPQEQALINIVAEIQQLIDSTLYKLRFIK